MNENIASAVQLLEKNEWDAIYLQGGKIRKESYIGNGVCRLSEIVIQAGQFVKVGCDSIELDDGSEEFCICISVDENFGDPNKEKLYKPRREAITTGLPDIPLQKMLHCTIDVQTYPSIGACMEYVLFESARQDMLLIGCDPDIPLHIQVIMDTDLIREKVASGNLKVVQLKI